MEQNFTNTYHFNDVMTNKRIEILSELLYSKKTEQY